VLGPDAVLGGLCRISSFIGSPGLIRHVGIEPSVVFGELDGRKNQRAESLREAFARAGVKARVSSDVRQEMWEKFLFIVGISGVSAVARAPVGVL
jgi:2-dehydropantoate 2-reductase